MSNDPRDRHLHPVDDDAHHLGRPPPSDLNAEMAVLGALMLSRDAFDDALEVLDPGDFYRPGHELIFDAASSLHLRGDPTDAITVMNELTRRGHLARAGGPAHLHACISTVPTAANAGYYADIVADLAERRRLVAAGTRITQLGYTDTSDPAHRLDVAAQTLAGVPSARTAGATTTSTWSPVDLAGVRTAGLTRPTATLLASTDGRGLMYPGAVHSISGEPTSGKSWVALVAVAQEVAAGHPVVYIDFEDRPETLMARLDDLGADPAAVDRLVRYIRPEQALSPLHAAALDAATAGCRVAVVDGVTEAMTLHGLDLSKNPDVAAWLELLPRRIANQGLAVWQIDHVVKDAESRGRYAIGGQHKLAGIVASYSMLVAKPFAPGKGGHARVVVQKDRHGDVGTVGQTVAELHMTPDPARSATAVTCALTPSTYQPADPNDAGSGPRLTGYMERISKMIEITPGMNQSDLITACGGKEKHVINACRSLLKEGFTRTEPGKHGAIQYHSLIPFREDA